VDGCAGVVRWRDRQNHAFASIPRNSADRNSTISSAGSMARTISRAERRGGPTFSAADQSQPQTARRQRGSDLCREPLSLVWLIEHMKATAVEDEVERAVGRRRSEKVPCSEAAAQSASLYLGVRSFDGDRRDIDSEYVKTAFCHPNCIRAGTGANLKRRTWRDRARCYELDEQGLWLPGVPGKLSRGVALIP
jgi:hypothetical protein